VASVLGYSNTKDALSRHVDLEDKMGSRITTSGQSREMTIINESGLYSLILKSKLPSAKKFKRWVTSEVLPAIRKHGGYLTPEKVEEALLNPDTIIQLATQLKEERTGRLIAEQKIA
ncbi:phage antirepressor, partial [Enterococcus faecium]|nr:phage antirepressor [Enterococcus faecium]